MERRGSRSEKALVAKPTNVPTPTELAPYQPRRARPPATSAGPMPPTPSCCIATGSRRRLIVVAGHDLGDATTGDDVGPHHLCSPWLALYSR